MFEQKRSAGWNFSWAGIVLVVAFVLAVFWIFRQNPPSGSGQPLAESTSMWSRGKLVEGILEVDSKRFLMFPLNLNKRSTLNATFTTGDNSKRLAFTIIDSADLEKWRTGDEVRTFTSTGPVPRGTIERVLEPGKYVMIFDNRSGEKPIRVIESSVSVE